MRACALGPVLWPKNVSFLLLFNVRGRRTVCAAETISEWSPGTIPKQFSRESPFNTPSQPRGAQNFLRLPAPARSFPPSFTKNNRKFLIAQAENSARPSMVPCRIFGSSKNYSSYTKQASGSGPCSGLRAESRSCHPPPFLW